MVSTIAPLVKVAPRQWAASTFLFVAASGIAGGAAGALLGAAGNVLALRSDDSLLVLGLGGLALAVAEVSKLRMPTLSRAVPSSWWKTLGPTAGAVAYGGALGLGISALIPFAGFYFLSLAALVLGVGPGFLIGVTYGLARATPVPVASLALVLGAEPSTVGDWGLGGKQQLLKRLLASVMFLFGAAVVISLAFLRTPGLQ